MINYITGMQSPKSSLWDFMNHGAEQKRVRISALLLFTEGGRLSEPQRPDLSDSQCQQARPCRAGRGVLNATSLIEHTQIGYFNESAACTLSKC